MIVFQNTGLLLFTQDDVMNIAFKSKMEILERKYIATVNHSASYKGISFCFFW